MSTPVLKTIPLFIFSALLSLHLSAQQKLKTDKVAIFKDGSAYFVKSGSIQTDQGVFKLVDFVPNASFGTFWVSSPQDKIKGTATYIEEYEEEIDLESITEILTENKKKRVKLIIEDPVVDEGKENVSGRIEHVSQKYVTLKTNESWTTVNINEIYRLEFLDAPVYVKKTKRARNLMQVEFKDYAINQNVNMTYLRNGLGWLPNYLLTLTEDGKADLTLRAMVFNSAEDLEKTDIDFVVGVPNFKYKNNTSPLFTKASFVSFVNSLLPGNNYVQIGDQTLQNAMLNTLSNAHVAQQTTSYTRTFDNEPNSRPTDTDDGTVDPADAEGESGGDLFFYSVKDITLKKGGHGTYDIMKAKISCENTYDCKLEDNEPTYRYYRQYNTEEMDYTVREVWHSLKLKNKTGFPWTTGTVLITDAGENGGKPLSEDRILYTPEGATTYIKMSNAIDVYVEDYEQEIKKVENKKIRNRVRYDLITVEGRIKIKNFKDKKVSMNITRHITGTPEESKGAEWQTAQKFSNFQKELNEHHDVCWEIELDAGKEKEIVYTYKVFVAN